MNNRIFSSALCSSVAVQRPVFLHTCQNATLTFFTVKIKTRWGIRWQGESKVYRFSAPKMQTCNKTKTKSNSTNSFYRFLLQFFSLSIYLSIYMSIYLSESISQSGFRWPENHNYPIFHFIFLLFSFLSIYLSSKCT